MTMADRELSQTRFLQAVEAALAQEDEGYARYRRMRRRIKDDTQYRPGPLTYDESGFPLPPQRPGLARRVARMLGS
jgi:hypothetical protein